MKCLLLSLQQLFLALKSRTKVFFCLTNGCCHMRGEQNFLDLTVCNGQKEALFSAHSRSRLSLSRMSSISVIFSVLFDFMLSFFQSCVSGSHCLCLTGQLNMLAFLKTTDTATGCHVEKRKKLKCCFNGTGKREKKSNRRAPSPLRW